MPSGVDKHDKETPDYFVCVYLFLMRFILIFFFFICSQSHISHYYVRSVFPHCNGSQLHKSPNPAWPPHLTKICPFVVNNTFKTIIPVDTVRRISSSEVILLVILSDSQSGDKVQFSCTFEESQGS